jgi:hypothetical protein
LFRKNFGADDNPCPTVALETPLPVYFTILNPAAVFTFTKLGIVPSTLDCQVLPAFQVQAA